MRYLFTLAVVLGTATTFGAQNATTSPFAAATVVGPMKPGPWTQYLFPNGARGVRVFLAHDERPKPLVVLLRGSGCAPLFVVNDDGTSNDTSLFQDVIAPRLDRFHFAMIENPGVEPLRFAARMSLQAKKDAFARSETDCSPLYRANQTKGARVDDAVAVLNALAGQPWVQRVLLIGHSEGSQVAAGVIRQGGSRVYAAALLSSAGPTQFFGFHLDRGADRESLIKTFDEMRMLQGAADDTLYSGEPARRWKSYALDSTPLDDVRDSAVPLYVAHGGQEGNLLSADLFVLEALRQQPRRPLRYVVVEGGDHAFTVKGQSKILELFDDFVGWAANPNPSTDARVLQ